MVIQNKILIGSTKLLKRAHYRFNRWYKVQFYQWMV